MVLQAMLTAQRLDPGAITSRPGDQVDQVWKLFQQTGQRPNYAIMAFAHLDSPHGQEYFFPFRPSLRMISSTLFEF